MSIRIIPVYRPREVKQLTHSHTARVWDESLLFAPLLHSLQIEVMGHRGRASPIWGGSREHITHLRQSPDIAETESRGPPAVVTVRPKPVSAPWGPGISVRKRRPEKVISGLTR